MLAVSGMMSVFVALISMASYWISWDLQPKESRPSFTTTTWHDVADVLEKCRAAVRNWETPKRTAPDAASSEEATLRISSISQPSHHS